jgi:hypothetical protein
MGEEDLKMAKFEVHYSFTCGTCKEPNTMRTTTVTASDKIEARDKVFESARCLACGAPLAHGQPFEANVKALE